MRLAGFVFALGSTLAWSAAAQNAIYKCVQGNKVTYSNEPCPNAKKFEVKDTKGVNYEGRGAGESPKR